MAAAPAPRLGLQLERRDEVVDVRLGDEDAVECLLLCRGTRLARAQEGVRLVNGLLGETRNRREPGVRQLAGLDGRRGVGRAVKAADLDLAQLAGRLESGNGTESHLVVSGDEADDVRVRLEHRLHLVVALGPVPARSEEHTSELQSRQY